MYNTYITEIINRILTKTKGYFPVFDLRKTYLYASKKIGSVLLNWYLSGLKLSGFQRGQPFPDGVFRKLGYTMDAKLVHNLPAVCLDGLCAYVQL